MERIVPEIEAAVLSIRSGALSTIRERTGLSRNFLALCLNIQSNRLKMWEEGKFTSVKKDTARRVMMLIQDFVDAEEMLKKQHLTWADMIPQRMAAMQLGIGTYALDDRMWNRHERYYDLDMLGLWLTRGQLDRLR